MGTVNPVPALCNQLKRKFRLTKTTDYQRVRRNGKSYAHPLLVLIVCPNESSKSKIAVSANRTVGNAVQRSSAKRKLREVMRLLLPHLTPGWDIILLARRKISEASFLEIRSALEQLLLKAQLITNGS